MEFKMGDRTWVLSKGQALRPDAFSPQEIEKLREEAFGGPSFWLHYQQGLGRKELDVDIDVHHFPFFRGNLSGKPVVVSVDPASKTKSRSRNAVHVYAVCDGIYVLLEAFAEACTFRKLLNQVKHFASHNHAALILVEETGRGGDLIDDLRSQIATSVEAVKQPRGPKLSRFRKVLPIIRARKVQIVKGRDSLEDVVDELITYPRSQFDDHVDALTNFLSRMSLLSENPLPEARRQLRSIGTAFGSEIRNQSREPVRGIAMVSRSKSYDPFR
jgi:predicted phage terminase large subunit-like protein